MVRDSHSKFDPSRQRKSIRLQGYDYSSVGAYFVTMVTYQRDCLFGEIKNGEMQINNYGEIVQKWWDEIPIHFPNVELGAFVIMPNHIHGIVFITTERRGEVLSPRDGDETDGQGGETCEQNEEIHEQDKDAPNSGGETPPLREPTLRKPTLGQIVAYFKYQSTKEMNQIETKNAITKFWQRNYYEHIIRNEKDHQRIADYIEVNPMRWDEDDDNPVNIHPLRRKAAPPPNTFGIWGRKGGGKGGNHGA